MLTDEELFGKFIEGDESCFDEIVKRYQPKLQSAVRKKLFIDTSMADDVVQNTWIHVFTNRASYNPAVSSLKVWLFVIAMRLTLDAIKVSSRRLKRMLPASQVPTFSKMAGREPIQRDYSDDDNPADLAEKTEDFKVASEILASLPEEQRQSIEATVLNGVSSRKAAPLLGVSHFAVQKRTQRGLKTIREKMDSKLAKAS